VFLPYIGGVGTYRRACDEVVQRGYLGFELDGPSGRQCNDGVIRRLQLDVQVLLDTLADLHLPELDTMTPTEAREFTEAMAAQRPSGPEVGEIVDGVLPGPAGDLAYRLYRPATPGPHPVVVYFHGGGWVFGSQESDDPLCRDLCVRSNTLIVSVNYRHAPEDPYPAAADDAFAALRWVAANAEALGGLPGPVALSGWSAGGNLAAVVCQLARDAGGPAIAGQVLLTPVTDCDLTRPSYVENADGYMLTAGLMRWFWDHYVPDPAQRTDPKASPLRAADLSNLPPAVILTCEFDPLRDEGEAYAAALAAAGNDVRSVRCRGHIHTSLTMVGVMVSGVGHRAEMAEALRGCFPVAVPG
jgi:acetyl esterase/lipase